MSEENDIKNQVARAQGCLLGQLSGDALGSLVEFQTPEEIRLRYPDGVRELADGGTYNTLAGQPTDDSEMALLLARMLIKRGFYDRNAAFDAYVYWLESGPFDCGGTIYSALRGNLNHASQANGAMMRISPLGIFGARHEAHEVAEWASLDASLTHPHPICLQSNALFAMAIAHAIKTGTDPQSLYRTILEWACEMKTDLDLLTVIRRASEAPPTDYIRQQGWVLIAFGNALWQLLHSSDLEEGIIDTVMRGGDTDTNAAICGALLGSVYGLESVPKRWGKQVLDCRPEAGNLNVHQPRPECFWPTDALDLANHLITGRDSTESG